MKNDEEGPPWLAVKAPEEMRGVFARAQRYVEKYFSQRLEDPAHGTITVAGERYILVRAASMSTEFFATVMSLYRDRGEEEARRVASSFLFDMAHAIGKADARMFHAKMGVTQPIDKLSAGPVHFAFTGWAFVDILPESKPAPDDSYFMIYDHPYSFEADSWLRSGKHSETPVCIMNCGYSSGWCEESYGIGLVAVELSCRAAGDEHCRFVMAPPERIRDYVEEYGPRTSPARHPGAIEVPEFFKRKRLEEKVRRYRAHLEELVVNRTQELVRANRQLRREIEDRERVEAQLRQAQKMEALGVLAGGIAHDFNNTLTAVMTNVQLAARQAPAGSKVKGWLENAEEAIDRAADLTRQMLAMSLREDSHWRGTDINQLVVRTAKFLERSLSKSITITHQLHSEPVTVDADVAQLEHALMNLAINARDAMAEGGELGFAVSVVDLGPDDCVAANPLSRPGEFVCIAVSDSGIGIAVELHESIFEPMFTTKGPSHGTGLGLAMVYGCAQAHAGWVSVDSEVGRGSTFSIYLPLAGSGDTAGLDDEA